MGLFEAFDKVSHQDWLDKINVDLKGKDFQETLVWNSDEDIRVLPFYNRESNSPSFAPIKQNKNWKVRETITIDTIESANIQALSALKGGVDSICFIGEINSENEMNALIKDIQTDIIEIHFYNSTPNKISDFICIKEGSISANYIGGNIENNIEELSKLITSVKNIKTITINGNSKKKDEYAIIKELAFNLNEAVEYLNMLTEKGIPAEKVANSMQFNFSIGSNYFFEIAKIRAARKLWVLVLEQFKVRNAPMSINSETLISIDDREDKNYTILRNTTKAMSAILGGCDSLCILPHDNSDSKIEFSKRIARNIQHILKEEAFFDKVKNPADGAYYIEELTEEIAKKSWTLFKAVESKGGYLSCIENNFIQDALNI